MYVKSNAEDNSNLKQKYRHSKPIKLYNKTLQKLTIQIKMLIKILVANFS